MEFCFELTMKVQDASGALATQVPITVQLSYRSGRWQAQCMEPPLVTEFCESMEDALKNAARDATRELATTRSC